MRFHVLPVGGSRPRGPGPSASLRTDNWDDYSYKTQYSLAGTTEDGQFEKIGAVKIGTIGRPEGSRVEVPDRFETLGESYFSLGQDDSYYSRLNALGDEI